MKRLANILNYVLIPDMNDRELEWMSDTKSMEWYLGLNIHQRINLKEITPNIIGVEFDTLNFMFSMRKRIDIIWNKLKLECIIDE